MSRERSGPARILRQYAVALAAVTVATGVSWLMFPLVEPQNLPEGGVAFLFTLPQAGARGAPVPADA